MADVIFTRANRDNFYFLQQGLALKDVVDMTGGTCIRYNTTYKQTSFIRTAAFRTGNYQVTKISLILYDLAKLDKYEYDDDNGDGIVEEGSKETWMRGYFGISSNLIEEATDNPPTLTHQVRANFSYNAAANRNTYIATIDGLNLIPNTDYYIYITCGPNGAAWDCCIYPNSSEKNRATTLSITFDEKTLYTATATFDPNGGTAPSPSNTITKTIGEALGTLPTTTRTGYNFQGWYTAKSGGTKIDTTTTLSADVTYYAHWTAKTLTLNYNANNGTGAPASQTWTYGGTNITVSSTIPTRNGYTFAGWDESSSATTVKHSPGGTISSTKWSSSQTLYAVWTPNKIKLTLDPNGGSGGTSAIWYYYGTSTFYSNSDCTTQITAITRPTRDGYTYEAYRGDGTCGGTANERYIAYVNDGGSTVEFAGDLAIDIYKDATLKASWIAKTFTLSYNANKGSGAPASQTWTYGGTNITISSTIPTRPGWSFEGWAETDSATSASISSGQSISSTKWHVNKTLYAVWSKIKYTLTIDANGGYRASDNSTDIITVTKYYGETEGISERKRTGHTLTGYTMTATSSGSTSAVGGAAFSFDNSTKAGTFTQGTVNITLTAIWTPNIYKVTLNNKSATTAGTTAYWYKFNTTQTINGEVIYYYTNSGCTSPLSNYRITCPTKTNYRFGGYYTGENGSGTQYVNNEGYCINNLYSNVAANTTLYAHWVSITGVSYTVKHWKQNLGNTNYTLANTDTYTGTAGATVTPAVKSYVGFTSPSTQSGTIAADGSLVINYYYTRNSYKLTVNKGTGIASVSGGGTYQYEASVTINATLSKGYAWSKWTGYTTSTTQKFKFQMPSKAITYIANATALAYTISYNANGGTGSMDSHTIRYGSTVTIKDNAFTAPRGKTFAGWTTKSDGTNDGHGWFNASTLKGWTGTWSYINGEYGIANQKLVLYAMWKPLTYTISYKPNGGSGSIASHTIDYGSTVTIKDNSFTAPTGHTFAGWTTNSNGTDDNYNWFNHSTLKGWSGTWSYINGQYGIANQQLVLYAMWKPLNYKLTINPRGGTWNGSTNSQTITSAYGSTKSIPAPTRPGYIFAGWYKTWYGTLNNSTAVNPLMTSEYSLPMSIYNNAGDGSVTHTRSADTSGGYSYSMKITTASPHTATPGFGGFVTSTNSASNATFIHVFRAKIPKGYYVHHYNNAVGNGSTFTWLTSKEGTGAWQDYAYQLTCGSSGTFSNFGYVALNSSSKSVPVSWDVTATQVTKNPTTAQTYTYGAGNASLYAQWIPETVNIYANGKWNKAIPYIYNGSAWKQTIPYVYSGGWKAIK